MKQYLPIDLFRYKNDSYNLFFMVVSTGNYNFNLCGLVVDQALLVLGFIPDLPPLLS